MEFDGEIIQMAETSRPRFDDKTYTSVVYDTPFQSTPDLSFARMKELVNDPTVADALMDRLVHQAHRIELKGESMRKIRTASGTRDGEPSDTRAPA